MDFDVGVLGLSSPPSSAVVTSYRPAVSVRNNGIHDAIASGYLRIYAAGLLIFETEVYSGTLTPGATGTADAIDYWTPPAEGTYIIQGYVSTPLDQVEPNNNLNPTTIIVTGGPVPPTPTVPLHAAQHEEGGTDPLNVDGLPGVLKDRQLPSAHAAQHQAGQVDVLNVAGLAGVLGEAQTPQVHGNAHHNPAMTTAAELTAHSGSIAAHTAATNLANRETTGPETGLLKVEQLQLGTHLPTSPRNALLTDRFMGAPRHYSIGTYVTPLEVHPLLGVTLISLPVPIDWLSDDMAFICELDGYVHALVSSGASLELSLWIGPDDLGSLSIPIALASDRDFLIKASIMGGPNPKTFGVLRWFASGALPTDLETMQSVGNTLFVRPVAEVNIEVHAELINADPNSFLALTSGFIRALHPFPA